MATFICVADESADNERFFYGGFAAPQETWQGCFADAWRERVLSGPPQIPYLHMTDITDWDWQAKYGLSAYQADSRVDCAADVICSTGRLVPVLWYTDGPTYRTLVRRPFSTRSRPEKGTA